MVSHTNQKVDESKYGHLKDGSVLLHQIERWSLYEMQLSDFQKRIDKKIAGIKSEMQNNTLFNVNGFISSDSTENFIYQNFDSLGRDKPYFSEGHYKGHVGLTNYFIYWATAKCHSRQHVYLAALGGCNPR